MTEFDNALARYKAIGASKADDAALMAAFCKYDIQILVGAVSPRLVWEGAQATGLSAQELARLAGKDPMAVGDLQWKAP